MFFKKKRTESQPDQRVLLEDLTFTVPEADRALYTDLRDFVASFLEGEDTHIVVSVLVSAVVPPNGALTLCYRPCGFLFDDAAYDAISADAQRIALRHQRPLALICGPDHVHATYMPARREA